MDDTTRRLDAIDDELEIGFDQKFEKKWRGLKVASQGVMVLFVLVVLAGLLGRYRNYLIGRRPLGSRL